MKTVVLVEPEIPENTGFIARLAENFDYELRIVNPEFNLEEARKTASSCQDKLREARIYNTVEEAVRDLDYIVGTKPGKGKPLRKFQPRDNTSIMIGRESHGLSNNELELCDAVVHIETWGFESLNQSHAAAILMHNFTQRSEDENVSNEKKQMLDRFIESDTLRKLVLRSSPTKAEIHQMIGELKKNSSG